VRFFHFRSQKFFVDRGRAFSTLHRATGRDYKNPQTDNYKKNKKGQIQIQVVLWLKTLVEQGCTSTKILSE